MRFTALRTGKGIAAGFLLLSLFAFPMGASARDHGGGGRHAGLARGRTIFFFPGYSYWGYDPFWGWNGFYDPYYDRGYFPVDDTGKIKLKNVDKLDQVYVNGAFAGVAKDMKTIKLEPGSYQVLVKHDNRVALNQRVYVVTGKTVKLTVGDEPNQGN